MPLYYLRFGHPCVPLCHIRKAVPLQVIYYYLLFGSPFPPPSSPYVTIITSHVKSHPFAWFPKHSFCFKPIDQLPPMSPIPAPGSLAYGWRAFSPDLHVSRISIILIVDSSLPEVICFCGKVPMLTFCLPQQMIIANKTSSINKSLDHFLAADNRKVLHLLQISCAR